VAVKGILEFIKHIFNKPSVIVEIGNDWVKIAECNVSQSGIYIAKSGFVKLAHIKTSISEAVSEIFRNLKLNKQNVITYLPRHLVTTRILEFPSTNPKEISDIINLQIGKQTPYTKEEIVFTYKVIDTKREGYTKVMLVIVKRNLINERLNALQKAGIRVDKVGLSSEGVFNWFSAFYSSLPGAKSPETVILVDIDSSYSDFLVICNGKLVFTKNVLIGANHLIEELAGFQDKFIEELKHSIYVYQEEGNGPKATKMFFSGAAINVKGLASVLSGKLDMPYEIINPFKNADNDFKFISVSSILGISMKRSALDFDLIPNEMRIKKLMEEKSKNLTIMGVLFITIMMMLSLLILINIYNKNRYIAQLDNENARIKTESDNIERMRKSIILIQDRIDAKGDSLTMLDYLYKILPKEICLTSVNIERKKQLTIRGLASVMSDVFKLVTALENSPNFKSVKNTYIRTKKEENAEYADFEIVCFYEE